MALGTEVLSTGWGEAVHRYGNCRVSVTSLAAPTIRCASGCHRVAISLVVHLNRLQSRLCVVRSSLGLPLMIRLITRLVSVTTLFSACALDTRPSPSAGPLIRRRTRHLTNARQAVIAEEPHPSLPGVPGWRMRALFCPSRSAEPAAALHLRVIVPRTPQTPARSGSGLERHAAATMNARRCTATPSAVRPARAVARTATAVLPRTVARSAPATSRRCVRAPRAQPPAQRSFVARASMLPTIALATRKSRRTTAGRTHRCSAPVLWTRRFPNAQPPAVAIVSAIRARIAQGVPVHRMLGMATAAPRTATV